MTSPKKAVALVRVSSAPQQHGHGLDRQDQDIATFLANNPEYVLEKTIQAIGQSAYSGAVHQQGTDFGDFLHKLELRQIEAPDALLISSVDRLTRLPFFEATALINRILSHVSELVVCDSGKKYSFMGGNDLGSLMELSLKIQLANEESNQKSKRLRAAREKRRTKIATKEKVLNNPPYWISWDGHDYVFNSNVKAVRKMVELRLTGLGSVAIQAYLNENLGLYPAPTKAGRWTKSRIDDILFKEPTITGDYVIKTSYTPEEKRQALRDGIKLPAYNKELNYTIEGLFPVVIDKVTFTKLKSGTGKGRTTNSYYNVFRSVAKCTCGGSFVTSHDSKKTDLDDRLYLKCNTRNQSGRVSACNNPSTKLFPLTRAILNHLLNIPLVHKSDEVAKFTHENIAVQLEEQRTLQARIRTLLETSPDSELAHYQERLSTVSTSVTALELEYSIALEEEANQPDYNQVLENLHHVRIDTPDGRLQVNAELRKVILSLVIDNESQTVTATLKDGTVTTFDPNEVGDIAETHALQFDRPEESDLSEFDE